MRQTNDFEDNSGGLPLIAMALGVSLFVLIVLVTVVVLNKDKRPLNRPPAVAEETVPESTEAEGEGGGSGLVASDLDFWDMYPVEEEPETVPETTVEEETQEDPSTDGKHVEVTFRDGTRDWVEIDPKLRKNTYDYSNFVSKNNLLRYYADGKQVSFLGVDLSRLQSGVNYAAIKNEGIDFCMLRVGARGYESGAIQQDERFEEHINGALAAGLNVGLYFYSQAVTEAEAVEEANFLLSKIGGRRISYPIAFDMEFVENDTSRIETLTKAEKTKIALAFLNRIKEAGYTPMLYGNKEWLMTRIDLSELEQFDIWLAQEEDIPDYPYAFSMWQYTRKGEVYGITGYVDLNVSFIDYSAR